MTVKFEVIAPYKLVTYLESFILLLIILHECLSNISPQLMYDSRKQNIYGTV